MVRAPRAAFGGYAWPAGAITLLQRGVGPRRPGPVPSPGLHTFVDPRQRGGRANAAARDELVGLLELDGTEYLHYRPMPVHVAMIRGTEVDPLGNIGCAEEPALLDVLAVAQAARASGGIVLAQVQRAVDGPLAPHDVAVPGPLVDFVVVAPHQLQTYPAEFDPTLGEPVHTTLAPAGGPAVGQGPPAAALPRRAPPE